jgi:hypothetical protein
MSAIERFPLTTADSIARWKRLYVGLSVLFAIVVASLGFRDSDWAALGLALFVVVPISAALRARRYERLLRDPKIASRIEKFRTLKKMKFEDACRAIEAEGYLVNFRKSIMASPSTWSRKQGVAQFDCDPFDVRIYERNGHVGTLWVFLKPDV